jgi:hypothetical protein
MKINFLLVNQKNLLQYNPNITFINLMKKEFFEKNLG